ncbi:hypothetical protein [Oscillibacter sp.]|uniref:hypothetical protein n=1 Tax=Oscillibacter sp. TaxID=1945593 RepID=UPI00289CDB2F|nr:hypothetical protein [Oscillibacter sp.]
MANFYNVSTDYLLGRTDCKDGLSALKEQVIDGTTTGGFSLLCCPCGQAGDGRCWNTSTCSV